jgi:hypothetical protein
MGSAQAGIASGERNLACAAGATLGAVPAAVIIGSSLAAAVTNRLGFDARINLVAWKIDLSYIFAKQFFNVAK